LIQRSVQLLEPSDKLKKIFKLVATTFVKL
jgi:hypothetical protein